MFDTKPGPLTDPYHLNEFDRIFKHGEHSDKEEPLELKVVKVKDVANPTGKK